jgi:3-oxoacyl-[acyl-carrier protein] reductase
MLRNKVAIVSGGSRGIGAATVLRLAADGWDVAFCYRADEFAANRVEKSANELGVRVFSMRADMAHAGDAADFVRRAEDALGPFDAVVACAGITRDRPLALMTDADWHEVMDVNLDGVFHLCRAALLPLIRRRRGSIVTLSSVVGIHGNPAQANYAASKAGVIGFTKALAKEAGRFGVRANTVAPGLIDTDMTAKLSEQSRARLLAGVPLRRFGTSEEVADLVSFLLSERAGYISGGVFEVHGGLSL